MLFSQLSDDCRYLVRSRSCSLNEKAQDIPMVSLVTMALSSDFENILFIYEGRIDNAYTSSDYPIISQGHDQDRYILWVGHKTVVCEMSEMRTQGVSVTSLEVSSLAAVEVCTGS